MEAADDMSMERKGCQPLTTPPPLLPPPPEDTYPGDHFPIMHALHLQKNPQQPNLQIEGEATVRAHRWGAGNRRKPGWLLAKKVRRVVGRPKGGMPIREVARKISQDQLERVWDTS